MGKDLIATVVALLIIAGTVLAMPSPADTTLDSLTFDLCINAPSRENYPDAKSVTLYGEKTIILRPDGNYTITWHTIQKVLTFSGKKALSNVKYGYDSDYEAIEITRARSITPAGDSIFNVSVVESLQINDITPPGLSKAGIYASLKQRVVTLPGVDDSSIVEISGTIYNTDKPEKPFGDIEFLAVEAPVIFYRLTIVVPEGEKLVFASANGAPEPIIEGNRYIWTVEDYPGIIPEPQGPLGRNLLPCVYYTTTRSWNLAADYIQKRFMPKALPTEEITTKAGEITGKFEGREAVDTLTSWVARNIKMIDLELGDAGFVPNDAATILKNSYADTRDRCVLLAALLNAKGFEPKFALLPPRNALVDENVPVLAQFSRMVVVIETSSDGRLWLWTEDDYTPPGSLPGYDGEKALLMSRGKGELVEVPNIAPSDNGMDIDFELTLDYEGAIFGKMSALFRGNYERGLRMDFRDASPRRRLQRLENIVSNLGEGELSSDSSFSFSSLENLDKNPSLELRFESKDFAFKQGEMMIFNFPGNPMDFAGTEINTSIDERVEPLVLPTPFRENYSFKVRIPDGYRVVWVSEPTVLKNDFGEMRVSSSVDNQTVKYAMSLTVNNCRVEPSEYVSARELMRLSMAPKNRMILLEKVMPDEPEIEGENE